MIHLIRPDINVDFLGKSKPLVMFSTLLAIASLVLLFTKGLNYGIDFTGGAEIQVKVPPSLDIGKLRDTLDKGGVEHPHVVSIGNPADREFLVKVQAEESKLNQVSAQVSAALDKNPDAKGTIIERTDVVGPQAGASLRLSAFYSIFFAVICIMIYIAFRFDFRYAPGVLRALGVDVIVTLGVWVVLQREFNLTVLASMLTIAGYSCNDTIIIYDRIRDFTHDHPTWTIEQAVNKSINLNLGRTVLTVLCTLFVVVSMFLLGGPVLEDFSLPLLIGFTISIPSNVFVATPMIVYMEKRRMAKKAEMMAGGAKAKKTYKVRPDPGKLETGKQV